jgi:hypothetical protein
LLPRRLEFRRGDVPVRPAFPENGAKILSEFLDGGPAEEPVTVVDLVNDKSRTDWRAVLAARKGAVFPIANETRGYRVRLNGEDHQWGKDPLKEVVGWT